MTKTGARLSDGTVSGTKLADRRVNMAAAAQVNVEVDLTDRELLAHARDGNHRCLDTLLTRYRSLVKSVARRYFLQGQDRDDVLQEGTIGLYKAIRDFDPEQETPFGAFAGLCISRQIVTAIKSANRHKHMPLSASTSLDAIAGRGFEASFGGSPAWTGSDPARSVISSDEISALRDTLRRGLTRLEGDVLHLFLQGKSYQQIAHRLGKNDVKHIDNTLQRVRAKVRSHLNRRDDLRGIRRNRSEGGWERSDHS